MRRASVGRLFVFAAAVMLGACDNGPLNPDRCNIRLAVVSPDPAIAPVGEIITLQAQLTASSCLPSDAEPANLRWTSADPTIATVDAVSGQVRAIKVGTTQISLTTATTHTLLTTSGIQVVSP